jgi:hypothetical protein
MYFKNRYYSQEVGRFLSRDPLRHASLQSQYEYVLSSPTASADPSGLWPYSYRIDDPTPGNAPDPQGWIQTDFGGSDICSKGKKGTINANVAIGADSGPEAGESGWAVINGKKVIFPKGKPGADDPNAKRRGLDDYGYFVELSGTIPLPECPEGPQTGTIHIAIVYSAYAKGGQTGAFFAATYSYSYECETVCGVCQTKEDFKTKEVKVYKTGPGNQNYPLTAPGK